MVDFCFVVVRLLKVFKIFLRAAKVAWREFDQYFWWG